MNTKLLDMIRKNLIYIIPVVLALAGFALLPGKSEVKSLVPASEVPEFILEIPINDTIKVLKPERKNIQETILVTELLKAYHYRKLPLDDSVSEVIYHNYLSSLDHSKLYFLKGDINSFDKYRFYMDDYLTSGNLDAAYQIFAVFQERTYQRLAIIRDLLVANHFDFTIDEEFIFERDELDWLNSEQELNEAWRKYIKNQLLSLKLSGKTIEEAIEILDKRYNRYQTVIQQYNSADVYQLYMNSFTEAYDPHTGYFNPITAENACGLARIVRSMIVPSYENALLWHERDLANSSAARPVESVLPSSTSSNSHDASGPSAARMASTRGGVASSSLKSGTTIDRYGLLMLIS